MKHLSVKNLKKRANTVFKYGSAIKLSGAETETGNDPTNTTVTVLTTTSHVFMANAKGRI